MATPSAEPVTRNLQEATLAAENVAVGKVHIVSLGCPKNLLDTERHLGVLLAQGYRLTDDREDADLLFVNTCGFIDEAKKESVDTILDLVAEKRDNQKLVVAGCLVDRYSRELKAGIPEVDLWINLESFRNQAEELARLAPPTLPKTFRPIALASEIALDSIPWASFPRVILTPSHAAYLKISEGCDHSCGFCAIPSFRGKHRSVPFDLVLEEARSLAMGGARELTLIGQDIVSYGKDFSADRSVNLGALLQALNDLEGIEWIRLLYTYPTRLVEVLESAYSNLAKLVPYLDLPLQHLSNTILERMRRGTPYETIRGHVARIRAAAPRLVLRSTCIVGFPGETEEDFQLLRDRFEELSVDHLGVFRYSDEEGTPAMELDGKVPVEVARRRYEEMTEWAAAFCQNRAINRLGGEVEVLVDAPCLPPFELFPEIDPSGKWYRGRWYGQAPEIDGVVYFQGGEHEPGDFRPARLAAVSYPDYLGE
jgi:ribosomal protein S12 methylthiotransferase